MSICSVVSVIHNASLVHCDLKPDNILVGPNRRPHLIDFGGVLELHDLVQLVHPGTAQYKAPERLEGCHAVPAIDVYSIGTTMYELLVGQHPYARYAANNPDPHDSIGKAMQESNPERLSSILTHTPQTLASRCRTRGTWPDRLRDRLLGDLDEIGLKAVAKNPAERYQTPEHLRAAIRSHLRD
jgi:serine/threonine protein kinase